MTVHCMWEEGEDEGVYIHVCVGQVLPGREGGGGGGGRGVG